MRVLKIALTAAVMAAAPTAANAALFGTLGGGNGPFLDLSSAGLSGGSVATLTGGSVFTVTEDFAAKPAGPVFEGTFLAAGAAAGSQATLSFVDPISYLSFLWGSPDAFNRLTVTTDVASYDFDVDSLGFGVNNGDRSVSEYVQFTASAGETIRSVIFGNLPGQDAFEVANFSTNASPAAVPEPATWAMMIAGFGMVAGQLRGARRRRAAAVVSA